MNKISVRSEFVPDLIWELTIGATGVDDLSTARWIWVRLQQVENPEAHHAFERAVIHWEHADEVERSAIGPFFGLGEPHGERWPLLPQIKTDYDLLLHAITQLVDPGEGYGT